MSTYGETIPSTIKAIDGTSVHKITSGQVVIDLQTAVKELVENSLDAGATSIEVRFKDYGLRSIEVVDNGSGVSPEDYDSIALKHYTSKLSTFEELSSVSTFGFRGEALSSLCALCDGVTVTTATAAQEPMGTVLEMNRNGTIRSRGGKIARQRGATVTVTGLFKPLAVRRKELERNAKREFGKALNLLNAYALVPCAKENQGVRFVVSNHPEGGRKTVQLRTDGAPSTKASVAALWGPKSLDNVVDLDLAFQVETERSVLRRQGIKDRDSSSASEVRVRGLISSFSVGCGRSGTDRQFFFINGRPCAPSKVQKAFNEVYRSFNVNQSPFIIADFIIPTNSCDINVSPDKRTILLHSENNLIQALKAVLEESFSPSRSTYTIAPSQSQTPKRAALERGNVSGAGSRGRDTSLEEIPKDGEDIQMGTPTLLLEPEVPPTPLPPTSLQEPQFSNFDGFDGTESFTPIRTSDQVPCPQAGQTPLFLPDLEAEDMSTSSGSAHPMPVASGSPTASQFPGNVNTLEKPPALPSSRSGSGYKERPVQMVLDTSGASWNLRRGAEEELSGPKKRRRVDTAHSNGMTKQINTREVKQSLRTQLKGFARTGSQVMHTDTEEDDDQDKEGSVGDTENDVGDLEDIVETVEKGTSKVRDTADMSDEESVWKKGTPEDGNTMIVRFDEHEDSSSAGGASSQEEIQIVDLTQDTSLFDNDSKDESDARSQISAKSDEPEVIRTSSTSTDVSLRFNLDKILITWRSLRDALNDVLQSNEPSHTPVLTKDAGISNVDDEEKAIDALSRVIDKEDFASMEILGQFNLGFIIARRRTPRDAGLDKAQNMDDLFIIDQHAADEKYNFETLQQTTSIKSQKLFRPELLELTAADELLAIENLDVLQKNGFEIEVDEDAVSGRRLKLIAKPVSKSINFDIADLEELIHLMHDRPTGQMVRCSKARSMFASRACRKSVMIGKPLTKNQMASVVQHMGTMDQPWNCPHGRPTMRHLSDIADIISHRNASRTIDWTNFAPI